MVALAEQSLQCMPAARASARLNGSRRIEDDFSSARAGTHLTAIRSAAASPWRRGRPTTFCRGTARAHVSRADASRLHRRCDTRVPQPPRHSLAVSRSARNALCTSGLRLGSGAVSERMSIRQPVSRAAESGVLTLPADGQ